MNCFTLESPIILARDDRKDRYLLFAKADCGGLYNQTTKLGFEIPLKLSFVDWVDIRFGKPLLDFNYLFDRNFIPMIADLEVTLGLCSRLGERLFQELISLNDSLKKLPVAQKYLAKTKEDGTPKIVYEKMDFMRHRDLLSEILKSKELEGKKELENLYSLPDVRKTLHKFVEDRNKYTHGILHYNARMKITVLEFKENNNGKVLDIYARLDQSILVSYINCYNFLSSFLEKIKELQKGATPSVSQ
jgi:hypothetical protein